jgi:demethylmenaquinone methyltransferase/2-methoxy-6-polyprenyl-1,4-benzoquinol methylase
MVNQREMFAGIAHRYDLMNRLMTAGQDVRWRREVIRRSGLTPGSRLLDLGTGTGDMAREAVRQQSGIHPVAADFTLEMMLVGRQRKAKLLRSPSGEDGAAPDSESCLDWCGADAMRLPFPGDTFDAVVSGFLLRNVPDIQRAFQEQFRVLKPGGRLVALDTTRPARTLFSPLVNFHMHVLIPNLGRLIAGSREAYTYLPESTEAFLEAGQVADYLVDAGFRTVGFRRLMFGTIAIHWGEKQSLTKDGGQRTEGN